MIAGTIREVIARRPTLISRRAKDPTGIRRVLRYRLAHPVAIIVAGAFVVAGVFGFGDPLLYAVLALLAITQVVVDRTLELLAHPIAPDRRYQIILLAWPVGFAALGLAGWAPDGSEYFGDVAGLVALIVAGFIGLASPLSIALMWSTGCAVAVVVGARVGGPLDFETALPVAALGLGAAFASSIRIVLESFLDSRRRALQQMTRVVPNDDPQVTARALVEPLVALPGLRNVGLIWFTFDDQAMMLALGGDPLTPAVASGSLMPAARNRIFRERAAAGAWITGWEIRNDDDSYTRDLAASGVDAVAYVPLVYHEDLIGVLAASLDEASGGMSTLAERMPILVEAAEVASGALGPSLNAMASRSAAARELDAILTEHRFWPVFQPVVDLATRRTVGYEALTRFEDSSGPQYVFAQAAALGRMREVETATLAAVLAAEPNLPGGVWLSVNASPDLIAGGDDLARLIAPVKRPIVVELSEHDEIADYAPIRDAISRLGPRRMLAVDDAGAGFASLRHILEAKPAFVKLDIGLVGGVDADASRRALVAGFVHFAQEAGFTLVAEGIETPAELAALRALGVHLGQGYLLGRPERLTEAHALRAVAS